MKKGRRRSTRAAVLSSPYWREQEAREALTLWRESGLSLSAFAARHEVGRSRLQRWKTQLEIGSGARVLFHPVEVVDSEGRKELRDAAAGSSRAPLELVLGNGRRIAVDAGFDGSVLEELVGIVESWGC